MGKRNYVRPLASVEMFTPKLYCASCDYTVQKENTEQPGFAWGWRVRNVSNYESLIFVQGTGGGGETFFEAILPAPTDVSSIHEMFSDSTSSPYRIARTTATQTTTSNGDYGTWTLDDANGNGLIDSNDYITFTDGNGISHRAPLQGSSSTAYAFPSATWYKYVKNHS